MKNVDVNSSILKTSHAPDFISIKLYTQDLITSLSFKLLWTLDFAAFNKKTSLRRKYGIVTLL